jgi:hypothetical protein
MIVMPTDQVTRNERGTHRPAAPSGIRRDEETLRALAVAHVERVRRLKVDAVAFVFGGVVLGIVWMLTEYQNANGWPERLSDDGGDGTWNPWIFWALLVWGALLAIDALKTFKQRPTSEAEIDREVERLKARR